MAARQRTGWELRFKWEMEAGITHPTFTFDDRMDSRERAVTVAWTMWPRPTQGMTLIEVHVRELPDGKWEHLLPVPPTCGLPPATENLPDEAAAPTC